MTDRETRIEAWRAWRGSGLPVGDAVGLVSVNHLRQALEHGDALAAELERVTAALRDEERKFHAETLISNKYAAALRDAGVVIERMANGASRAECSPEFERVHDVLFGGARTAQERATICVECGSGILDGEHIADYPCSARAAQEGEPHGD